MEIPVKLNLFVKYFLILVLSISPLAYGQQEGEPEQEKPAEQTEEEKKESDTEASSTSTFNRSDIKIAPPINSVQQLSNDLKHYLSEDQVKPMLAGTDEFITLEKQSESANSKGVAIFIPDWQQTPTSPKAINYLRKKLPELGWMTIALQAANMPDNYPSTSLKEEEKNEQNQKALADYQTVLKAKLTALMEKAQSLPGLVFVVVAGNHSALVFDLYQKEEVPLPSAVLMLSGYSLTKNRDQQLAKDVAETDFPVLDLYLNKDNKLVIQSAKERRIFADKTMKVFYRQKQMSNFKAGYYQQPMLLKEINGWFKTIGW